MKHLYCGLAVAFAVGACTGEGGSGGNNGTGTGAGETASLQFAITSGPDFAGNSVHICAKRSRDADPKYFCQNQVCGCFDFDSDGVPVDSHGNPASFTDLCPSLDYPTGDWTFQYTLYPEPQCQGAPLTSPDDPFSNNLACYDVSDLVTRAHPDVSTESLLPGENHNEIVCLTKNASKTWDFDSCADESSAADQAAGRLVLNCGCTVDPVDPNACDCDQTFPLPEGCALDPDQNCFIICGPPEPACAELVYVTDIGDSSVFVIDPATDAVIATVPVQDGPSDAVVTPDSLRVYVSNSLSGSVSRIETATNTVGATIPIGAHPFGEAISPDGGTLYVSNSTPVGTVTVLALADELVTAQIPVGNHPIGIAFTPDGSRAYVANEFGFPSVIDPATMTVVGSINDPLGSVEVKVLPSGTKGYLSDFFTGTVTVFRVSDGTVVATIPIGPFPEGIALSPDGAEAWVAVFGSGTVGIIETATDTLVGTVPVGYGPLRIAFLPDGSRAYVTNNHGIVSVVDRATRTVVDTVTVGREPFGVAVTCQHLPAGK